MSNDEKNEPITRTIERIVSGDTRHVEKNLQPLQVAGQDEILRHYTLGGVETDRDVRMYLDLADLERLCTIARLSRAKRVVLPKAGITVMVRRSRNGHIYETMHIESMQPVPEKLPDSFHMPVSPRTVSQWGKAGFLTEKPKKIFSR